MNAEVLAQAQEAIGYQFENIGVLELALTHASFSDSRTESNERLEFLGDAVLGHVICARIFERFPSLLEGQMTKIKSTAVSRKTCAKVADRLGLGELILLGKGMQTQDRLPSSLAAGVLEAVIAAIYLDGGFEAAASFICREFDPVIERAERSGHQENFKSVLQQYAQATVAESPIYRVLDEKGPDHAKAFKVAVELAGHLYEPTWGQSKKQAEQRAALHALEQLGVVEADDAGGHRVVAGTAEPAEA